MGRTLHFSVLNPEDLTEAHKDAILAVSERYNSGPLANAWTCENFFLDPLMIRPPQGQTWKDLDPLWRKLESRGLSPLAIRRKLLAAGQARHFWGEERSEIRGFTKVGGNEWNAALVYAALLEISRQTPALIRLADEGEFLLCDVLIKKGKARPDRTGLAASLAHWEKQGFLDTNEYGCADKARLYRKLLKQANRWQAPEKFCRAVNPADFAAHPEYNAGEIMAGFHGEYYGLTDKNPFDESMHAIARIKELFAGQDVEIRVAPKLRRSDDDPRAS